MLFPVRSWAEIRSVVRTRAIDVAVIDPCADGSVAVDAVLGLRQKHPSMPILVYTTVRPDSLHAAVDLARYGVGPLILYRFDDSRSKFLAALEGQPGTMLSSAVLKAIAPALAQLPHAHAAAIEDLFRHPGRYRSASELAAAAGINRKKMYRLHHMAGLASPWMVVSHARLLHAYTQLREGGHLFVDIETRLGYSPGRLRALMRRLFGNTPLQLRSTYNPNAFVTRVVSQVYPLAAPRQRRAQKRRSR
jgi:AraC-like DNA-binding protein